MFFLVKCSLHMLSFLWKAADVLLRVSRWKNKLKHHRFDRKKECTEPMKKSCLIAVITALAAVAGALAAVAVYLHNLAHICCTVWLLYLFLILFFLLLLIHRELIHYKQFSYT